MAYKQAKVYVGDVGVLIPPSNPVYLPAGIDWAAIPFRELCNIAITVGIDVRDIIGVKSCKEHEGMIYLGDKEMPEGYNLFEHCVWCKGCFQLFRLRSI